MADNKTGKDASGATFTYGTKQIASVDYPYVCLGAEVGGIWVPYSAANPLPAEIVSGSFSLESGADPLTTGNDIDVIEPTITISASAYTANDVVGGPITITNAMGTLLSGILQNIFVQFKGALTPDLDIYLFKSAPTQTTTDTNTFAWDAADDAKLIWVQHVLTADYITIPGATTRTFAPVLCGYPALKSAGANLYAFIVAVDAFTAASTSDLRVGFGMARD